LKTEVENKLVTSAREGDRNAYARLVAAYSGRVFAICLGMLADRHDAEDTAQQTLLRGYMQIGSLRNSERFGVWIAQIARNACVDALRRRKPRVVPAYPTGNSAAGDAEDYQRLKTALATLSEEYRLPLLLFYFNGRSTKSIAETLGISRAAVQTRLSRARRKLRHLMVAEGLEP